MEIRPNLKSARFAKLESGDLFVFYFEGSSSFGLKVIDPSAHGDTFVLPLRPAFVPGLQLPFLLPAPAATMISFGKDFIFQLSSKPDAWSTDEPSHEFYCAALLENIVFLRCNGNAHPGRYLTCWVNLNSGVMHWGSLPAGIASFSVKWEILLPQVNEPPKLILEQLGNPLMPADRPEIR